MIVPKDLTERLITSDEIYNDIASNNKGNNQLLEQYQYGLRQVLLFDRFSLHHELGHLYYMHQAKRNTLLSAGIAAIVFSVRPKTR